MRPGPAVGHHASGGPAKVIVDDLDLREATAARVLDQVVLAALALRVVPSLRVDCLAQTRTLRRSTVAGIGYIPPAEAEGN